MLLEELGEGRNGDIERVGAIVLLDSLDLRRAGDAPGLLEPLNLGLGLGVDVVLERVERLPLRIVEKAALLEEERDVLLSANLVKRG
jgi:hypothetical protein